MISVSGMDSTTDRIRNLLTLIRFNSETGLLVMHGEKCAILSQTQELYSLAMNIGIMLSLQIVK